MAVILSIAFSSRIGRGEVWVVTTRTACRILACLASAPADHTMASAFIQQEYLQYNGRVVAQRFRGATVPAWVLPVKSRIVGFDGQATDTSDQTCFAILYPCSQAFCVECALWPAALTGPLAEMHFYVSPMYFPSLACVAFLEPKWLHNPRK